MLFSGTGIFLAVSLLSQVLYRKLHRGTYSPVINRREYRSEKNTDEAGITIERWKLYFFLAFQVIVILINIMYMMRLGKGSTLAENIYNIRVMDVTGNDSVKFPWLLIICRRVISASIYFFVYVFVYGCVYRDRSNRTILLIIGIFGVIFSLLSGGRASVLLIGASILFDAYFIYGQKKHWGENIKFKTIVKVIILLAILLLVFQSAGSLLGRKSTSDAWYYIAKYLSAQLKNLGIFIRNGDFGADFAHSNTLIGLSNLLNKIGISQYYHQVDLPFLSINGRSLGNVYTIFYSFLYDGGYVAHIFYTALTAVICQIIYHKAIRNRKGKALNIALILYSYMMFSVLFSFFGNFFYESFLGYGTIENFIIIAILSYFFTRVRIRVRVKF